MSEKIVYEKHPVTAERKAELRQKGYKIIDAKFAPDDYKHPEPIKAEKAGKPNSGGNKPKTDEEKLRADLTEKGIQFDAAATLDELKALLPAE